jgi:glyoxylase-like metal-dependent hydrolase (beta-lactamase superfamily II)
MRLRDRRLALALPFAFVFLGAAASAPRQDRSGVVVKTTAVAGSVHLLEGAGGNVGVSIGADGVLMIDDEFADLAPKLQAAIDAAAGKSSPPRYLLNTHFHGDHTGGNAIFGMSATVVAHDNVRKRLAAPKNGKPMESAGLPAVTYASSMSVHFNGEEVRLAHFDACHTDGDTVIHFVGSNVWHLGDLYFNGRFPFVDLGSGGSVVGLERAIGELLARIDAGAKIIPGHGPLAQRADLESYRAMLADSIALVKAGLAAGKSADEMVASKTLAKYESLAWQFISLEAFTKTVANDLSASTARK